jgi:Dyp-type peroxidase family
MAVQEITPPLDLDQIQGNILAPFNKEHQSFIFVRLSDDQTQARAWLAELLPDIATTTEVAAFNRLFKEINARRGSRLHGERGTVESTWVCVAFTAAGLSRLGQAVDEFPEAFRAGMAARADQTGDSFGANAPSGWVFGQTGALDGVVIVAADSAEDLDREVAREHRMLARHGATVVFEQRGQARTDLPGHEHFGFKDGISQPGVRGFTETDDPTFNQGQPGQDLIWPGEFVLGYPKQRPAPPGPEPDYGQAVKPRPTELDPEPGDPSFMGPSWANDGSYLVVRRLRQDVPAFIAAIGQLAAEQTLASNAEKIGAKLVGRYESGAPLEVVASVDSEAETLAGDPSRIHPELLADAHINDFEFAPDDADGHVVPLAAHIRKAYPRNEATIGGGEADTQTHRLLRRGIAFGAPYKRGAAADSPHGEGDYPHDRGLVFACYQADIGNQFEVVQAQWANRDDFPEQGAGQDPIISQSAEPRSFTLPGGQPATLELAQFVTTTGGEYFFQPSIAALALLSGQSESG